MSLIKKTTLAVATAAVLGLSASSYAAYTTPLTTSPSSIAGNWYASIIGGVAFTQDVTVKTVPTAKLKYDSAGFDVGGALGYRSGPFRYEGEYTFMRTGHSKLGGVSNSGRTVVHAGMANVFYSFQNVNDQFTPYIGGGVGYASIRPNGVGLGTENEFAYQGMAGLTFNVDNEFDVGVGYRFFGTSEPKKLFTDRFQNHMINLAVIYHIPE